MHAIACMDPRIYTYPGAGDSMHAYNINNGRNVANDEVVTHINVCPWSQKMATVVHKKL